MSRKLRRGEHIGEPPGQLNGIRETGPVRISRYRYTAEEHRVDRPETLGEALEDTIHGDGKLEDIHALRRELIRLRKVIWPLRTVFAALKTAESDLLGEALRPFLLDLHDNGIGVLETFEVLRDHVGAVVELSASRQNTTMNEIMKTLTIVASVFIPLTFIAGIYGMNFVHMPELEWRFGYPGVLGFMAVVAGFMLVLFRRRRWL
ncbi:MAG: CorA family divalent cation transporter [Spirochaetaceae bacterium]